MSKIRCDSIWNSLTPEQRQTLEDWLFVKNMGYREVSERAQKEWGVTGSSMSVARYYRRVEKERVLNELEAVAETAVEVSAAEGKMDSLRTSAMKVMGMRVLENVMARGDVKELAVLGRVLTQTEEREIQRGRLALAQKKFEFNAAKAALKQLPKLDKMRQEDEAREDERIDLIRLGIFGKDPVDEVEPPKSADNNT